MNMHELRDILLSLTKDEKMDFGNRTINFSFIKRRKFSYE